VTLTIIHGGQTGVDRGAHEAALDNGWPITGFMPRDRRDELGQIPDAVARFLTPHTKTGYGARTEANVQSANAALIVVRDAADPRSTPGTAKTISLAADRRLLRLIVDPKWDPAAIARWIWSDLIQPRRTLSLPLLGATVDPDALPKRLLVAGPRESLWRGARAETAELLRRVGGALVAIAQELVLKGDLAGGPR
jgi:hypothetical protein